MPVQAVSYADYSTCKPFWSKRGLRKFIYATYDKLASQNVQAVFWIDDTFIQGGHYNVYGTTTQSIPTRKMEWHSRSTDIWNDR